jgi:hypothetical protein
MKKLLLLLAGVGLLTGVQTSVAGDTYFGVTGGFARTIWAPCWTSDGYADAGNGAFLLEMRAQLPYKEHLFVVPFVSYLSANHTTSYRTGGYEVYDIHTERTYFREIGAGVHMHYHLPILGRAIYVGGGPALRFHESGRRSVWAPHQMDTHSGTSPALCILGGWATRIGEKFVTFFEPQVIFSPDAIDRQETYYPPDRLSLQMGILWK